MKKAQRYRLVNPHNVYILNIYDILSYKEMRLYSMNKNFLKGFCVPLLATSLLTGCAERDTEPPKIEVAKEDLYQEMYFGYNLNLIDWYNYDGRVKVTDNVDKDIKFRITADEDDLPSLDELRDNLYKVQDEINAVNEAKSHSNN